ncbi:thiazolylpeptide-type bacteriocin [Streptomyces sp. NPDC088755]|uniref:thiazolylpeptide-type bacteriocin n=1 Tax=Streptomyces sp. NPDC088755 TaxID=3365888 RepID=UPI00380FE27B
MSLPEMSTSFEFSSLELGEITVTAMRDTAGIGESTYSLSSSSSTSCQGCSGCSVQPPLRLDTA